MKIYLAALIIFLLAFAGLATGIILKRKGLRGSCNTASGRDRDCECKPATDTGKQASEIEPPSMSKLD